MAKSTFEYKGRIVEVVSIDTPDSGYGFGVMIDGVAINRGGYGDARSEEEAIEEGKDFAQEYIDSLP